MVAGKLAVPNCRPNRRVDVRRCRASPRDTARSRGIAKNQRPFQHRSARWWAVVWATEDPALSQPSLNVQAGLVRAVSITGHILKAGAVFRDTPTTPRSCARSRCASIAVTTTIWLRRWR